MITLEEVQQWLRGNGLRGPADTGVEPAYRAAVAYVSQRCRWVVDDDGNAPHDLRLAVCLLTSRYLQRRNSPDGLVAMGELGPGRVPTVDPDVRALIGPYRVAVV